MGGGKGPGSRDGAGGPEHQGHGAGGGRAGDRPTERGAGGKGDQRNGENSQPAGDFQPLTEPYDRAGRPRSARGLRGQARGPGVLELSSDSTIGQASAMIESLYRH